MSKPKKYKPELIKHVICLHLQGGRTIESLTKEFHLVRYTKIMAKAA